jgi:peroxiredoxin
LKRKDSQVASEGVNTFSVRIAALVAAISVSAFSVAYAGQESVANSAAEAVPIKVGERVPDALLGNQVGKSVRLRSVLRGKPTVIIFYRGEWCPFCNAHLSELAAIEGDVRKRGYQIIAISPDISSELAKMAEKDHLTYKMFSDSTAEAMRKFGVAFRVDDETYTKYRDSYHIDLERSSGQTHHILPVPSVFIVDKSGKIIFAHANADYKVRLKGLEILSAIDAK